MQCLLCGGNTKEFWKSKNREFVECTNCGSIQLLPEFYVSKAKERERYQTHNNDVEDPRYIKTL